MPPEEPAADPAGATDDGPAAVRSGFADWLWVPLLTAAIAAGLVVIGRGTFVA